jgi:hypothetical protein
MITFKPPAGSIISYHDKWGNVRAVYLITGYEYDGKCAEHYPMDDYRGANIANLLDLHTNEKTHIIVQFNKWKTFDILYNENLTVVG